MSAVKMIKTKIEDINEIACKIGKIEGVKAIYLFGSYAQGNQHNNSDIDLCVIGSFTEKEETEILMKGSDNLDISIFTKLPILIRFRVLAEGKPLIIMDKEYIQKLKSYTLREYLDFKPAINKFIMETFKCTI